MRDAILLRRRPCLKSCSLEEDAVCTLTDRFRLILDPIQSQSRIVDKKELLRIPPFVPALKFDGGSVGGLISNPNLDKGALSGLRPGFLCSLVHPVYCPPPCIWDPLGILHAEGEGA